MSLASRAEFQQRRGWYRGSRQYVCESCAEEQARERAREAEERQRQQQEALRSCFSAPDGGTLEVADLSFEEAVTLLSVVRAGASEDLGEVTPVESWQAPLTPTAAFDEEIVMHLFQGGLLAISATSAVDAFLWEGLAGALLLQ